MDGRIWFKTLSKTEEHVIKYFAFGAKYFHINGSGDTFSASEIDMGNAFTSVDAWAFAALLMSHKSGEPVDPAAIQDAGDFLNHAILTTEEIDSAIRKCESMGIVAQNAKGLSLTEAGERIRSAVKDVPPGELIDACFERLQPLS